MTKTTLIAGKRLGLALALVACGMSAGAQNVTYDADNILPTIGGGDNTVVGLNNMLSNTGYDNTSIGRYALFSNVSGNVNTAVGYGALNQNIADGNCAFGPKTLAQNQNGTFNSAYGFEAMINNISGNYNSSLGFFADVSAPNLNNATAIGANAIVNANDRVWIGDAITDVWCQAGAWNTSDQRFKFSVKPEDVKGLDFIKLLRPVVYNFDTKKLTEFMTKNMTEESRNKHLQRDFSKSTAKRQTGFLAQEVEQAAKTAGYNFSGVHVPEGDNDTYGLAYSEFVVPLVKAVQEQQQLIEQLQQQVSDLQTAAGKSSGATGINSQSNLNSFSMAQNEPNPFTHETVIKYNLPEQTNNAYMAVYDLSGKQITTFALTQKGSSSITVSSEKLVPGIYIYSIVTDGKVFDSKKMIVADK